MFAVVDQNFGGVIVEGLRAHPADFTNLVLLSATRQSSVTMALHSDASSVTDLAGQPMADLFYGKQGDFRLLHFEIYGVEGLLTYALENLPLSRLRIGEVQKVSRTCQLVKTGETYFTLILDNLSWLLSGCISCWHYLGIPLVVSVSLLVIKEIAVGKFCVWNYFSASLINLSKSLHPEIRDRISTLILGLNPIKCC